MNKVSFPGLGIGEMEINSVAIKLGSLQITWYSLIITTGIILAVLYVHFRFKEAGLSVDDLIDFALFVVPSGIIGARLYYVIFKFEYYWDHPGKIFAIWEGGLAIYGGVIAGGIAAVLVARHKKIKMLKILDMLAPAVMMAQALGRWGNFANVEAFGGPTSLPWRMCSDKITNNLIRNELVSAQEIIGLRDGTVGAHPTFLYESLWNLVGFLVIYFVFVRKKKLHKIDGQIFYSYLIWYGLGRLWIEGLRTDSLYLIDGVIRVSQLVALLSLLAGIGLMTWGLYRYFKFGEGEMILVIPREKKEEKKTKNKKPASESAATETEEVNINGTNNQRKRSGSKGKRRNKKSRK